LAAEQKERKELCYICGEAPAEGISGYCPDCQIEVYGHEDPDLIDLACEAKW
jgi:NMD protein affecting ribosome stability and mRNA decay